MSEIEKVPYGATANGAREAWRVFGIMSEFVEATERLTPIRPAVSIFGSARPPRNRRITSSPKKSRGCSPTAASR